MPEQAPPYQLEAHLPPLDPSAKFEKPQATKLSTANGKHAEGTDRPTDILRSAGTDAHRQQAAGLLRQLQHLTPQARAALDAVQQPLQELEAEADRREERLQRELAPLSEEMRSLRQQRTELLQERQSLQSSIAALQAQHDGLTQEMRDDQARLDELNGKIVNASPVNQMKAAIKRLSSELQDMQISIGVALQRLRNK